MPNTVSNPDKQAGRVPNETNLQPVLSTEFDPVQLTRWAELISDGFEPFPSGLDPVVKERLAMAIRRNRKNRLFLFIAKAIAFDIHKESDRITTQKE